MKTSFSKAILFLAIGIISLTSCKQEDPAKEATISLKVTSATSESIAFEITTENAKTFSYAVGKTSEISAAEYKTQDADNGNPVKLETTGLQANTEYTIKAFATNTEGRNTNEVAQTATTSESASIRIEILEKTSHSVKFKLTPLNAIRYAYTIVETSSEIETVPLDKIIDQDSESEFEETGLKENTNYSIIAAATNAEGEESERTYMSVLTEIEPVITVSEIQPSFNQAIVSLYSDNASGYGYAAVEKGKEMPQRSSFKTGTITEHVRRGSERTTNLEVERHAQRKVLEAQAGRETTRHVGLDIPQVLLGGGIHARHQAAVATLCQDDVALRIAVIDRTADHADRLADLRVQVSIGTEAIRTHTIVRQAIRQLLQRVAVARDVGVQGPGPVFRADDVATQRQLDTPVADQTGVHDPLGVTTRRRRIHLNDLVLRVAVIEVEITPEAVVEHPPFGTHLV